MLPTTKVVFPRISVPYGQIELIIRAGEFSPGLEMTVSPGVVADDPRGLYLAWPSRYISNIDDWVQRHSDEDGGLVADSIGIELIDSPRYAGTWVDGLGASQTTTALDEDLIATEGRMFFDALFADTTLKYYAYLRYYNGVSRETWFSGTIDPLLIERQHGGIFRETTAAETITSQTIKLYINPLWLELKQHTAAELVTAAADVHFVHWLANTSTISRPWYGGIYPGNYLTTENTDPDTGAPTLETPPTWDDHLELTLPIQYGGYEIDYRDTYGETGFRESEQYFPENVWAVSFEEILTWITGICSFAVTSYTIGTAFYYTTNRIFSGVYYDGPLDPDPTHTYLANPIRISFNHAFGVTSFNVTRSDGIMVQDGGDVMDNPISWKRETPFSQVLADICWQLGSVIDWDVTSDGRVSIQIVSRRASSGTLPSTWRLIDGSSSEGARNVGKAYVEVKCKGDDTSIRCPAGRSGDAINIELMFRTRPMGRSVAPVFRTDDMLLNKGDSPYAQPDYFAIPDASKDNSINPNSWVLGAHLFEFYDSDVNVHWPGFYADHLNFLVKPNYTGYYALRSATEKWDPDAGPIDLTNRDNVLYAAAQLYARELLGDRRVIERRYAGILDDSGSLRGMKPMVEATWHYADALRTFRGIQITKHIMVGETTISWEEKPDNWATLADIPVEVVAGNATTGGSSGGSTTQNSASYTNTTVTGITGTGPADYITAYGAPNTIKATRARVNQPSGVLALTGKTSDITPAIYGGATTTGYTQSGVKGESDSGAGVEAVAATGHALTATRNNAGATVPVATITQANVGNDRPALELVQAHPTAPALDAGSKRVANVGVPTASTDAATKAYVDAARDLVEVRAVVTYDFTANDGVPPHGIPSPSDSGGVTLTAGKKVLYPSDSDATLRGFYIVAAGTWARSSDPIKAGMAVVVLTDDSGFGGGALYCTNTTDPVIGTDSINFARIKALPIDNSVGASTIIDGSVGTAELADSAVTPTKVDTTGAATWQVLGYDGAGAAWINQSGGQVYTYFPDTFGSIAESTTKYAGGTHPQFTWDTEDGGVREFVPRPGTLRNLMVRVEGTQPATGSLVITVYVNGLATSLQVTVLASGTTDTIIDLTHGVDVVAGDYFSVEGRNDATGASIAIKQVSLVL